MNWIWVLFYSLPGFLIGFLSVYGITGDFEIWYWIVLALFIAFIFSKYTEDFWFRNGFMTAFLTGIWNSLTLTLFMETYFVSNPETAEMWIETAGDLEADGFIFFSGFPIGAAYGVFVGIITLLMARYIFKKTLSNS
ncbi:MAG: hypothetical protein J0L62_04205 [Bacteroidetes bacterium]|nr:hypothetical protein [Bacteroidota bacterium]